MLRYASQTTISKNQAKFETHTLTLHTSWIIDAAQVEMLPLEGTSRWLLEFDAVNDDDARSPHRACARAPLYSACSTGPLSVGCTRCPTGGGSERRANPRH